MNREWVSEKCDRVLVEKLPFYNRLMEARLREVYEKHESTIGQIIDYDLLTEFSADLITAVTGVYSKVTVDILQEVLSDSDFSEPDDLDKDDE